MEAQSKNRDRVVKINNKRCIGKHEIAVLKFIMVAVTNMGLFRFKTQNFVNRLYGVLNIVEKNRITQMDCKSRDESNEPN